MRIGVARVTVVAFVYRLDQILALVAADQFQQCVQLRFGAIVVLL